MTRTTNANPILPAAGVCRKHQARGDGTGLFNRHDDDAPLNPKGRGALDCGTKPKGILKCKRPLKVASFNIQTLSAPRTSDKEPGLKTEELTYNLRKHNIAICGIQEHRRVHQEEEKEFVKNSDAGLGYNLYTISAWRNSAQASTGGVGILVSNEAQKTLTSIDRISDRILKASFKSNPVLTIIVAYSPCEYAETQDKDTFYNSLRLAIESVPQHNFLIILGDFNARLGPEDVRFTYSERTNENGERLIGVMEDYQLEASNTVFQKKKGKLWTWLSPRGTVHQIDFILTRKKWRKSVLNCESYSSFASLGSDHRIVTATIRLCLRAPRKSAQRKPKFKLEELRQDKQLQARYAIEIRNRFAALQKEEEDSTERYQNFIQANQEAAETCLKKVEKTVRKNFCLNKRISSARERIKKAYSTLAHQNNTDDSIRSEYTNSKDELYRNYSLMEQEEISEKIKQVEEAHDSMKYGLSWQLINDISGRKSSQAARIKGNSSEDRVQKWYTHFKNLLGKAPELIMDDNPLEQVLSDLEIDDHPFTMEEYRRAKKSLKNNKCGGEDGIMPEILKYVPIDDVILDFINQAYNDGKVPEQWSTINIVPVPKSGDMSKTDNYRGISLISVVTKLYNRMILNRLRPVINPLLRDNQNGFREKRSTVSQVLALRRILEGARDKNLTAVITFIDFAKAFDSVHREKLFKILTAYSIPEKLVSAIKSVYNNTKAKVCSPDGETDYFEINAGVMQGDTLAPFLFIVALDYALRLAITGREEELGFTLIPRRSRRVHPVIITDLDFADDIALISDTTNMASELLQRVETECEKIGLHLNARKTKVMVCNTIQPNISTMNGTVLEVTEDFKYLGSWVSSTQQDIKVRRALAWKALHSMRNVWRSNLRDSMKRRLFVSTVESVLLYGAETWTLTSQQNKALDGAYTRMLRVALNKSWKDHVKNKDLYGRLQKVSAKIRERRLRLAGHCVRHQELMANKLVLWEPSFGRRGRGRKKDSYVNMLIKDTGLDNASDLRCIMQDRTSWRRLVHESRVGVG